ncbi:MAG TPA: DUF924 family protein [Rhizomicrobium sp.]|jgi:uncharacterized protein (DUF924 family)
MIAPDDVLTFWRNAGPDKWYAVDPVLDAEIRTRFEALWQAARSGSCADWEATAEGTLALLIVLDQFPRNMFRGHAGSFATDARAREVARRAVARNCDLQLGEEVREFFYTPIMHAEDIADQEWSVALFGERLGKDGKNYPYALAHRDIIRRFGRFPARNEALGRISTPEETAFLAAQPPH